MLEMRAFLVTRSLTTRRGTQVVHAWMSGWVDTKPSTKARWGKILSLSEYMNSRLSLSLSDNNLGLFIYANMYNPWVWVASQVLLTLCRAEKKSLQILLSSTQAGPGRNVKQEQEEISRNHIQRLFLSSVPRNKVYSVSGRHWPSNSDSGPFSVRLLSYYPEREREREKCPLKYSSPFLSGTNTKWGLYWRTKRTAESVRQGRPGQKS